MVLTSERLDDIIARGGSGDWKANSGEVSKRLYWVGAFNARRSSHREGDPEHGHAFLIGKVSHVSRVGNGRVLIHLSEYSKLEAQSPSWPRGAMNPVRYMSVHELRTLGIDLNKIPGWTAMKAEPEVRPLSIEDAKKGLALTFGVTTDSIEIIIRA